MANNGPPADGEDIIRVPNAPAPDKNDRESAASEAKKKLHWLEIGYFSSQIILAAIGIWALTIYHGRLTAMQGQLDQMGKQSAEMQKQTTVMDPRRDRRTREGTTREGTDGKLKKGPEKGRPEKGQTGSLPKRSVR